MLGKAVLAGYAEEAGEGWTDEITEVEMTDKKLYTPRQRFEIALRSAKFTREEFPIPIGLPTEIYPQIMAIFDLNVPERELAEAQEGSPPLAQEPHGSDWDRRWDAYQQYLIKFPDAANSWRTFWAGCESEAESSLRTTITRYGLHYGRASGEKDCWAELQESPTGEWVKFCDIPASLRTPTAPQIAERIACQLDVDEPGTSPKTHAYNVRWITAIIESARGEAQPAPPQRICSNPNHANTDGSIDPHEIGPSCMAEAQPAPQPTPPAKEESWDSILHTELGTAHTQPSCDGGKRSEVCTLRKREA
jgi:hypothetical protein